MPICLMVSLHVNHSHHAEWYKIDQRDLENIRYAKKLSELQQNIVP